MNNSQRYKLVKKAQLEGAIPSLLQRAGDFAGRNPYLVGGLGLGTGLLGLRALSGGRDREERERSSGPGIMGVLGTLGLLGGGGYLLDRVGGLNGLRRGFDAAKKFSGFATDSKYSMGDKFNLAKAYFGLKPEQQSQLIKSPTDFFLNNQDAVTNFQKSNPKLFRQLMPEKLRSIIPEGSVGGALKSLYGLPQDQRKQLVNSPNQFFNDNLTTTAGLAWDNPDIAKNIGGQLFDSAKNWVGNKFDSFKGAGPKLNMSNIPTSVGSGLMMHNMQTRNNQNVTVPPVNNTRNVLRTAPRFQRGF